MGRGLSGGARLIVGLLLHGVLFFVSGLVGLVLGGGNLLIGFAFVVAGLFGPWMYLGFRRSRRPLRPMLKGLSFAAILFSLS